MVLLRIDPGLVIWLWITFGVVLLILRFTAWDRIIGALDKRSSKISSDIESANQAAVKAAAMLKEYEEKISQGKAEAARIVEMGRAEASRLKEAAMHETREEIHRQKAHALVEIERAREDAELALKEEIVSISFSIADAILRREISVSDNKGFVEEFAEKLSSRRLAGAGRTDGDPTRQTN
jgi:F-type H+-transporting ATPase subunit b